MQIELPEFVKVMGLPMLGAFLGTAARSQKWRYPDDLKMPSGEADPRAGKMNWRRAGTEWISCPAIGMIVAGVGQFWHFEGMVTGGLAAGVGLIGAAALGEIAERGIRQKVDTITTGASK